MTNDRPVENVLDDNPVSIDLNCLNNDDVIPVPTTTDSFNDEITSVANSSANATPRGVRSSIELETVSDVLLSSLPPQTESSVTKTSESSSKASKPAAANIAVFQFKFCGSIGFNRHITVSQKRGGCVRLERNFVIAGANIKEQGCETWRKS